MVWIYIFLSSILFKVSTLAPQTTLKKISLPTIFTNGVITSPELVLHIAGISKNTFNLLQDIVDEEQFILIVRALNSTMAPLFDYCSKTQKPPLHSSSIFNNKLEETLEYLKYLMEKTEHYTAPQQVISSIPLRSFVPKPMKLKAKTGLFPMVAPFLSDHPYLSKSILFTLPNFSHDLQNITELLNTKNTPYTAQPLIVTTDYAHFLLESNTYPSSPSDIIGPPSFSPIPIYEKIHLDLPPTAPYSQFFQSHFRAPIEIPALMSSDTDKVLLHLKHIDDLPLMKNLLRYGILSSKWSWNPKERTLESKENTHTLIRTHEILLSENFLEQEIEVSPFSVIIPTHKLSLITSLLKKNPPQLKMNVTPIEPTSPPAFQIPLTATLSQYLGLYFDETVHHVLMFFELSCSRETFQLFLHKMTQLFSENYSWPDHQEQKIFITKPSIDFFNFLNKDSIFRQYSISSPPIISIHMTHIYLEISQLTRGTLLKLHNLVLSKEVHIPHRKSPPPPLPFPENLPMHLRIPYPFSFIQVFEPQDPSQARFEEALSTAHSVRYMEQQRSYINQFINTLRKTSIDSTQPVENFIKTHKKFIEKTLALLHHIDYNQTQKDSVFFTIYFALSPHLQKIGDALSFIDSINIFKDLSVTKGQLEETFKRFMDARKNLLSLQIAQDALCLRFISMTQESKAERSERIKLLRKKRPCTLRIFLNDPNSLLKLGPSMNSFLSKFPTELLRGRGRIVQILFYEDHPIVADADISSLGFEPQCAYFPPKNEATLIGQIILTQTYINDTSKGYIAPFEDRLYQLVNNRLQAKGFPPLIAHGNLASFPQNLSTLYCDLLVLIPHSSPCIFKDLDTYIQSIYRLIKAKSKTKYYMQINQHLFWFENHSLSLQVKEAFVPNADEATHIALKEGHILQLLQQAPSTSTQLSPILKELTTTPKLPAHVLDSSSSGSLESLDHPSLPPSPSGTLKRKKKRKSARRYSAATRHRVSSRLYPSRPQTALLPQESTSSSQELTVKGAKRNPYQPPENLYKKHLPDTSASQEDFSYEQESPKRTILFPSFSHPTIPSKHDPPLSFYLKRDLKKLRSTLESKKSTDYQDLTNMSWISIVLPQHRGIIKEYLRQRRFSSIPPPLPFFIPYDNWERSVADRLERQATFFDSSTSPAYSQTPTSSQVSLDSSIAPLIPTPRKLSQDESFGTYHQQKRRASFAASTPTSQLQRRRVSFDASTPTSHQQRRRVSFDASTPTSQLQRRRVSFDASTITSHQQKKQNSLETSFISLSLEDTKTLISA